MASIKSLRKQFERFKKTKDFRKIYEELWVESAGRCSQCGVELIRLDQTRVWINGMFERQTTVDHVKPLSKGGENIKDNFALLCLSCNARKGTKEGE